MIEEYSLSSIKGQLSAEAFSRISDVITAVVQKHKSRLADIFYDAMLADKLSAQFLSVAAVEGRLKPSMAVWIESLAAVGNNEDFDNFLAAQRHIGEVHARAEIPVSLVARGIRLLKRELTSHLLQGELQHEEKMAAVLWLHHLLDSAFEEMSISYQRSHESGARTDEAFRVISIGQNLSLEREKQFSALLEWENLLFRNIATDGDVEGIGLLGKSTFSMWLNHKAALMFTDSSELDAIDQIIERIDGSYLPRLAARSEVPALIRSISNELDQIRFLLSELFDRMNSLEVGRDALTHVFNRRFMPTILRREVELCRRHGKTFCVLMVDIDHFKQVNDKYGHDAGDRALQAVSGLLLHSVRASDFVFRYGGEEFMIVLAEVEGRQAQLLAEKIRKRVEAAQIDLSGERTIAVTVSIGLAEHQGHPDYQLLLDSADQALYEAKHGGRNRVVVAETADEVALS